jgi:hypothetical protein
MQVRNRLRAFPAIALTIAARAATSLMLSILAGETEANALVALVEAPKA